MANAYSLIISVVSAIHARFSLTTDPSLSAYSFNLPQSLSTLARMVGSKAAILAAEKKGLIALRRLRWRSWSAVEKVSLAWPKRPEK